MNAVQIYGSGTCSTHPWPFWVAAYDTWYRVTTLKWARYINLNVKIQYFPFGSYWTGVVQHQHLHGHPTERHCIFGNRNGPQSTCQQLRKQVLSLSPSNVVLADIDYITSHCTRIYDRTDYTTSNTLDCYSICCCVNIPLHEGYPTGIHSNHDGFVLTRQISDGVIKTYQIVMMPI